MRNTGDLVLIIAAMWITYWVHPYTTQNMMSLTIEAGLAFFIGGWITNKLWGHRR